MFSDSNNASDKWSATQIYSQTESFVCIKGAVSNIFLEYKISIAHSDLFRFTNQKTVKCFLPVDRFTCLQGSLTVYGQQEAESGSFKVKQQIQVWIVDSGLFVMQ